MYAPRLSLSIMLLLPWAGPLLGADERTPVPDAEAQAKAEKLIKEVFKEDYATTRATGMLDLSGKLMAQVAETKDDPVARFVLLREARDLAARAGDPVRSLKAVDQLAREYAVDSLEMKATILETAGRSAVSELASQRVAMAALSAAEQAAGEDRYEVAGRMLKVSQAAAQKSQSKSLLASVQSRCKAVVKLEKAYDEVRAALAGLDKDPEDPAANLTAGTYYCLRKGDWEKGLPMLAKGSDKKLKDLAEKDTASPDKPKDAVALADGWWDLASEQTGAAKMHLRERAAYWYKLALPELTGLLKAKAEKRLQEMEAEAPRRAGNSDIYATIAAAIKAGNTTDTKQLGTGEYIFREVPPAGGLLTGFEITYGTFGTQPTIKTFRPIFQTAKGRIVGKTYGFAVAKPVRIEAKPGYAVGAIKVRNGLGIDGMSVTFMEIEGNRLNPDKAYTSRWYGGKAGQTGGQTLGGGAPVIGIFGKVPRDRQSTFNGLGLVLLDVK